MFKKLFEKKEEKKEEDSDLEKISKMNLSEMKLYVINRMENLHVTEDGILEVLKKLTTQNSETSEYYLKNDDMDSKIKKGFDLIITISKSSYININIIESIQKFIEIYDEIIKDYDIKYKEIYMSRLKDALNKSLSKMEEITNLRTKMNVLNED